MKWKIRYVYTKEAKLFKTTTHNNNKTTAAAATIKNNNKVLYPKNIHENTHLLQLDMKQIYPNIAVFQAQFFCCQSFYGQ